MRWLHDVEVWRGLCGEKAVKSIGKCECIDVVVAREGIGDEIVRSADVLGIQVGVVVGEDVGQVGCGGVVVRHASVEGGFEEPTESAAAVREG